MVLKAWKKLHYIGVMDVDPRLLLAPAVVWRAREADPEHVKVLRTSLQRTQSANNKGVKLVAQSEAMWKEWSGEVVSEEECNIIDPTSPLYKSLIDAGLMPFTGDHTRLAVADVAASTPNGGSRV